MELACWEESSLLGGKGRLIFVLFFSSPVTVFEALIKYVDSFICAPISLMDIPLYDQFFCLCFRSKLDSEAKKWRYA